MPHPNTERPARLGARIRAARRERGWTRDTLAKRAGVSRTTLHHLERGETSRPRADTLARLAEVLGLATAELHGLLEDADDGPARFDRATNGTVDEVHRADPGLFAGWTPDDWDALYSTFGTGGALNEEGVRHEAERINRQRETIDRLRLVLETHLADVAERMIGTLYEMVLVRPDDGHGSGGGGERGGAGEGEIGRWGDEG